MSLSTEKIKKPKIKISKSNLIGKGKNYKIESNGQSSRKVDDEKKNRNDIVAKISTMISKLPLICEGWNFDTIENVADGFDDIYCPGSLGTPDTELLKLLIDNKVIDTFKVNLQLVNAK